MAFLDFLNKAVNRQSLEPDEAEAALLEILRGGATTPQVSAWLVALRMKGETAGELAGFARAMRAMATAVPVKLAAGEPLLDTCGTGGDGHGTFNVSTTAAFVVAGVGVKVAKHGNRSITSRSGSADLLEALGVRIAISPDRMARAIEQVGIAFLFAPALHPAVKYVQPARLELKIRTVFNILGPLANPAGATAQVIGAPEEGAAEKMALALAMLGGTSAYVVSGEGGMDEATTTGATAAFRVRDGAVQRLTFAPDDFGVPRAVIADLAGGDPARNATITREVLAGAAGPCRDIVLVNAALALMAAGRAAGPAEGVELAARSIDSGAAREKLDILADFTQQSEE